MKACERQREKECPRVAAIVSALRSYYCWASAADEGGALSNRSPYWSRASVSESVTWGDEQHCWVCGTHRTRHGYSLINWSHTALLTGVIWIKNKQKLQVVSAYVWWFRTRATTILELVACDRHPIVDSKGRGLTAKWALIPPKKRNCIILLVFHKLNWLRICWA